jgi:hypothetical protein
MKDLLKKFVEFAKKHLMSIIYGVIALAAVGAIFWPINGLYDELKAKLEDRGKLAANLQQTLTKVRLTPVIPGEAEQQGKLEHFPTKQVIANWQAVTKQIHDESQQMFDAAVEMNKRPLLIPNVLPDPPTTAIRSQFRDKYYKLMNIADENVRPTAITQILKPGFMPSDAAINAAKATLEQKLLGEQRLDPNGQPLDPGYQTLLTREKEKVPDELKTQVGENCLMYVQPDALDPSPDMLNLNLAAPDAGPIYIAQVGYWIQEDVLKSLADANMGATNVKDAPIKHLWKMKFASNAWAPLQAGSAPADAANQSTDPASEWKLNFANSLTGRETNGIYDVYRFSLRLFVDADRIDTVLHALTRGKLINVVLCDVVSRDTAEYASRDYFYGDKPIVQLDLQCEALLLRKWTTPLMPPSVRTALGVKLPDKAS